jgi:hypothetical protein
MRKKMRMIGDLPPQTMEAERQWGSIFKELKVKSVNLPLLKQSLNIIGNILIDCVAG